MSLDTRETSSPDIILPPGLWLPLAEEPTDQYLSSNMDRPDLPYELLVDYGSFIVALNVLAAVDTENLNYIPKQEHFRALRKVGYGISIARLEGEFGGLRNLQGTLGFFADNVIPSESEVLDRLKWMATGPLNDDTMPSGETLSVIRIFKWGWGRKLLPSDDALTTVLGPQRGEKVRRIFGMDMPPDVHRYYTARDTYKLGQRILDKHGAPIKQLEVDNLYSDDYIYKPYNIIRATCGSMFELWSSFGLYPDLSGVKAERLIDLGAQYALRNAGQLPARHTARLLSRELQFMNIDKIINEFGNYSTYKKEVNRALQQFGNLTSALIQEGVSDDVIHLLGANFRSSPDFSSRALMYVGALQSLSSASYHAGFVRKLLLDGFDLRNDDVYRMQLLDLKRSLRIIGVRDKAHIRYMLGLMPRIDIDETVRDMSNAGV